LNTTSHPLSSIWLKASVAGGLWASVEIIVGSFLHNIRIPFAGGVLASFGVILMIAFYRMWPERGLLWRAGVICALMKSISPSAIILGPMIGILSEAILLDLFIRLLGKSLPAMMFAGGVAVTAAFAQKILNILVIYGMSLVKVYLNLIEYAAKQIGLTHANPWVLILILAGIYFLMGLAAAIAGYLIGRRSLELQPDELSPQLNAGRKLFMENEKQYYSAFLLFLSLLAIPGGIILMNTIPFYIAVPVCAGYIIFCLVYYPILLRRLKNPFLWVQFVIIIVLSGLFWKSDQELNGLFDLASLQAGVEMSFRAILVISGFTGISSELRSPLVRAFLFRRGLREVYSAVSLAFQALPSMLEDAIKPRELFRQPLTAVAHMLARAGKWEKVFEQSGNEKAF